MNRVFDSYVELQLLDLLRVGQLYPTNKPSLIRENSRK